MAKDFALQEEFSRPFATSDYVQVIGKPIGMSEEAFSIPLEDLNKTKVTATENVAYTAISNANALNFSSQGTRIYPDTCRVCRGKGKRKAWEEADSGKLVRAGWETCTPCTGKGWLYVTESLYSPSYIPTYPTPMPTYPGIGTPPSYPNTSPFYYNSAGPTAIDCLATFDDG